jgi:hypothetical protein
MQVEELRTEASAAAGSFVLRRFEDMVAKQTGNGSFCTTLLG